MTGTPGRVMVGKLLARKRSGPPVHILAWNVHVRQGVAAVRRELGSMIVAHHPHVIVLTEAAKMHGHLSGLGYHVVQLPPQPAKHGVDEAANIAVLVRNDLRIRHHNPVRMRRRFKGPKHGWPHPPRVFQKVAVEDRHGHLLLTVMGLQQGFGALVQAESLRRIGAFLAAGPARRPRVAAGDWNKGKGGVRAALSRHHDGIKVVGSGVDLMAVRGARGIRAASLGHHGSDHPAMLYRFSAPKAWKAMK